MLSLSIPELLDILLNILITIAKIALIFVIMWLGGRLFRWIWRSLIIPIFQRRAYFYAFKEDDEGFYVEKPLRLLWFRLRRNKRWALQKDLIGYVAKRTGGSIDNPGGGAFQAANDIFFLSSAHKTLVGQVKSPEQKPIPGGGAMKICEVILKRSNLEGDTYYDTPVGFINDKGEVYKYYKDRKAALKGKKLDEPILIGYARAPQLQEKKNYPGSFDTDSEAAIDGIDNTTDSSEWFFFRKRKKSKVKAQKIESRATNRGFMSLWAAGWRVLHAHFVDDYTERKMRPWGIGYAVEDFWRNIFTKDVAGFGLDARAVAALLLAEKEGFYLRDGEQVAEGTKGLWPTALLSLVCYLSAFPFLNQWTALEHWFEGLVGPQISKVIALILIFFGIWLIIHIIRMVCYDATDRFESFLNKMNNNVGTTNWNTELIVISFIGLILSIFVVDYLFFPIFFCALIVFIGQRAVFGSYPWPVENPLVNLYDETQDEEDEMDESEKNFDEEKEHKATIFSTGSSCELRFKIPYQKDELKRLRASNPFRNGPQAEYSEQVRQMIEKEFREEVYSRIKYVKGKIDRFSNEHHLSFLEKISVILKLSQPDNIIYHHDYDSEELLPAPDEPAPIDALLKNREDGQEGKGYAEYCRYPTETLYDKRGDCDCHAALAVSLLAACGIKCCYFTNQVNSGGYHAALGIEVNKELQKLVNDNNCFTFNGNTYLYAEATGHECKVGDVPDGFQRMLQEGHDYAVIEPANFKDLKNEE